MEGLIGFSSLTTDGLMNKGRSYIIFTETSGEDIDYLYNKVDMGLSIFRCNSTNLNLPIPKYGMLEHLQRSKKGDVADSFIVQTYHTYTGELYRRYGVSSPEKDRIVYSNWNLILASIESI